MTLQQLAGKVKGTASWTRVITENIGQIQIAQPGKVTVAGGPGSISQIAFERINRMTGGHMTFIPYKDTNQAFPDLVLSVSDILG